MRSDVKSTHIRPRRSKKIKYALIWNKTLGVLVPFLSRIFLLLLLLIFFSCNTSSKSPKPKDNDHNFLQHLSLAVQLLSSCLPIACSLWESTSQVECLLSNYSNNNNNHIYLNHNYIFNQHILNLCHGSCEEKKRLYNWTYECIMRACSLPAVPPLKKLHNWKAYCVTTPTTTTTSSTPIFNGLHFQSIQLGRVYYFFTPFAV